MRLNFLVYVEVICVEQQSLFNHQSPPEVEFLESIRPRLEHEVSQYAGDSSLLQLVTNLQYVSVMIGTSLAFSIRLRGKLPYISVPSANKDVIPSSYQARKSTVIESHTQVLLGEKENAIQCVDFMVSLIRATIDRYPSEWNCCSRYMECSNARHCTHPDRKFALSCGYQKILRSGRIFYGENRNID